MYLYYATSIMFQTLRVNGDRCAICTRRYEKSHPAEEMIELLLPSDATDGLNCLLLSADFHFNIRY